MNQFKPNKIRPKVKQKRTRYNKLIKNISTSAATHLTNITLLSLNEEWKRWSHEGIGYNKLMKNESMTSSSKIFYCALLHFSEIQNLSSIMGAVGIHHLSCWCRTRARLPAAGGTFAGGTAWHRCRRRRPPWPEPTHHCPTALTHLRWPRAPWWAGVSPAPQQSLSPSPCFVLC